MENKITLNMNEAAKVVGVSVPVMRELAQRPGFPAIRAGSRWVIPRNMLVEWLEAEAAKGLKGKKGA